MVDQTATPRKRKTPEEQLEALQVKEGQLKARIQKKKAEVSKQKRKQDTRRKIVGGGTCEAYAKRYPDDPWSQKYWEILRAEVTRPEDRKLFDL